jgi:hypothetical protein
MRNRQAAVLAVSLFVVVLIAVCVLVGPTLLGWMLSMHTIPQH